MKMTLYPNKKQLDKQRIKIVNIEDPNEENKENIPNKNLS